VVAYALLAPGGRERMPVEIFTTVKGELITTRDLRGRVVLVDFWATDCDPCLREMPQRVELYTDYRQLGFELVAVAMSHDRPDRVLSYAENNKLPFKVALDVQGTIAQDFGDVEAIPTSFLIDKHGRIVRRFTGTPDVAELRTLIEAALKEPA
jgi:peroxiredoxin